MPRLKNMRCTNQDTIESLMPELKKLTAELIDVEHGPILVGKTNHGLAIHLFDKHEHAYRRVLDRMRSGDGTVGDHLKRHRGSYLVWISNAIRQLRDENRLVTV